MPVVIHIPAMLRPYSGGASRVKISGAPATVRKALDALYGFHPELRDRIEDEQGRIRRHVNIFVDSEIGALSARVGQDAEISIIPAVSGGRA